MMETKLRNNLQHLAEGYQSANPIALSTIGYLACRDARFLTGIFAGERGFTVRQYDVVVRWFHANWPQGVPWPKSVDKNFT